MLSAIAVPSRVIASRDSRPVLLISPAIPHISTPARPDNPKNDSYAVFRSGVKKLPQVPGSPKSCTWPLALAEKLADVAGAAGEWGRRSDPRLRWYWR